MSTAIDEIAVVVPSRNEAALLPRSLSALEESTRRMTLKFPHVRTSLTVVLDSSTDTSAELLARHPQVRVRSVSFGRVGAARNAGIAAALSAAGVPSSRLWVATTDADSAVPVDWLEHHYTRALAGVDVLVGTVEPFPAELDPSRLVQWHAWHELREGHSHVHGANLGFRADIFTALGGFPDIGLHEDREFVAIARARGSVVQATDACRVRTSGRLQGRVEGGFAGFLATLDVPGDRVDPAGTSAAPR
ncbi:glycosyltransferase [Arthrobacter sp. H35-D1]|uniref:glycosyltransferase n=1 Tax=Arthrobacter sp. H35-D1 TaxID=3046202 RepID=UPI0024BA4EFC|nr:glycosyltransferase [Arthrobacter sp. H35-D1]MDJ0314895.1 glycosyltransferase [Arthrobacter sp. H35-D1]